MSGFNFLPLVGCKGRIFLVNRTQSRLELRIQNDKLTSFGQQAMWMAKRYEEPSNPDIYFQHGGWWYCDIRRKILMIWYCSSELIASNYKIQWHTHTTHTHTHTLGPNGANLADVWRPQKIEISCMPCIWRSLCKIFAKWINYILR